MKTRQALLSVALGVLVSITSVVPHPATAATYNIDVFAPGGVPGTGGGTEIWITTVDLEDAYETPLYEFPVAGTVNFGTVSLGPFLAWDQYGDFGVVSGALAAQYGGFPPPAPYTILYNVIYVCNINIQPTCFDDVFTLYSNSSYNVYDLVFPVQAGDSLQLIWTDPFSYSPPTQTPLPAALPLFASGLGALGLLGWRRKRKAQATA